MTNIKLTSNNVFTNETESKAKKKVKKSQSNDVVSMNKKNSQDSMTNGTSKKYDRNSLIELDAQIMNIQSQFESELEGLIGPYNYK